MPTPRNSSLPIPLPKILSSPTNTHNPGLPQMPSQRSPLLPVLVHPSGSVPSFGELPRALHNENWSESFISRKSVVFPTAVGLPGGLRVQTGEGFGASWEAESTPPSTAQCLLPQNRSLPTRISVSQQLPQNHPKNLSKMQRWIPTPVPRIQYILA